MIRDSQQTIKSLVTTADLWNKHKTEAAWLLLENAFSPQLLQDASKKRTSSDVTETIITLLPVFIDAYLVRDDSLDGYQTEYILDLLSPPDNLERLLSQPEGKHALAWFCCDHTGMYLYGTDDEINRVKFNNILSRWTGLVIDKDFQPEPDAVVELLYGETVWTLYSCDLKDQSKSHLVSKALNEIARARLPFVFQTQSPQVESSEQHLPQDIS